MKKILAVFVFVLFSISSFAYSNSYETTYTMGEQQRNINAYYNNKGNLIANIDVIGNHENDIVMIYIAGEENITQFVSQLRYCREKLIEWSKISKENNITDYTKKLDTNFPKVEIWWKGSKYFSSYGNDFIKPLFFANEKGETSIIAGGEASDWENNYITQKWFLFFHSTSEIDSLIEALDITMIKSELDKNKMVDNLFK